MISCGACGHAGSHAFVALDGYPGRCPDCATCRRFEYARSQADLAGGTHREYDYRRVGGNPARAGVVLRGTDLDGVCLHDENGHTRHGGELIVEMPSGMSEYWTPDGTTETDPASGNELTVLRYTGR